MGVSQLLLLLVCHVGVGLGGRAEFYRDLQSHLATLTTREISEFATTPPVMSKTFAGNVRTASSTSASVVGNVYLVYDEVNEMQVQDSTEQLPFPSVPILNISAFVRASNGSFLTIGDRCQPLPPTDIFASMFTWLAEATSAGETVIDGRKCDLWTLDVPLQGLHLSMCVEGNLPVAYNVTSSTYHVQEVFLNNTHATLTPSDEAKLKVPEKCFEPPSVCDGGEVQTQDVFIFHPAHQFDIYNEDVADLLGDTAFICADALSNHTADDAYEWVSRYKLQVWSGWGDYAECNRPSPHEEGVCISFEKYAVGREASYGLKPGGGQCSNNSDTGTWLSLPKAGMCSTASQTLGPKGGANCSWRILDKLKTINGTCLLKEQGMLDSCAKETDFPFSKSQAVLLAAFESEDPSKGGCPGISTRSRG